MQSHREFQNPPIKEAIIDIQIAAPKLDIQALKLTAAMAEEGFTESKSLFSQEFKLRAEGERMVQEGDAERALAGFRFDDENSEHVVQFRSNGFTFSKIGNYSGWDAFRDKAMKAWHIYCSVVGEFEFTRLAVRFINILALPRAENGGVDLDRYLVNSPKVPEGMPDFLNNFFSKVDVRIDDPECVAAVTQAPARGTDNVDDRNIYVALDIDVFNSAVSAQNDDQAWEFIEKLRDVKNMAFNGSITEETKELIDK